MGSARLEKIFRAKLIFELGFCPKQELARERYVCACLCVLCIWGKTGGSGVPGRVKSTCSGWEQEQTWRAPA